MSDFTYCILTAIELCLFSKTMLNNITIMRTKQFLLSLLFLSVGTYAQEVNYYFEQYTNSYENLEDRISLTSGKIWDDPELIHSLTSPPKLLIKHYHSQVLYHGVRDVYYQSR